MTPPRDVLENWHTGTQLTSGALVLTTIGGLLSTGVEHIATLAHALTQIGQFVVTGIAVYMAIRGLLRAHQKPKPRTTRRRRNPRSLI